MKVQKPILSMLLVFSVIGCSAQVSEPSNEEVMSAVKAAIAPMNEGIEKTGKSMHWNAQQIESESFAVNKAQKMSCAKANGQPGYNCDVDLDIRGYRHGVSNLRFVKSEKGWTVVGL